MRGILNKKAGMELSMGTIVILVLGVSMLILGIILVRNIMCSGLQITKDINEGVRNELKNMFGADQIGVNCMGEGNQEINLATGDERKVVCLIRTEEQTKYKITATDIKSIKGASTEIVNKWALVKEWEGDVSPGSDTEADYLLLDLPREAPKSTLRVTVQIENLDTGTRNTKVVTLHLEPVGAVTGAIC